KATWAAFGSFKEAADQLKSSEIRAHLFDFTVLPAPWYAAETWVDTASTSKILRTTHRLLERFLLKYNRHSQYLAGMRSSDLRNLSHFRDPGKYTSATKHRWAGHVISKTDEGWTKRTVEWTPRVYKRPLGRRSTRWA
ncbi:hypothetical protein Angca_006892, partial [Angiostrongylus cantonensis]